ncbi:hypothetical protein AKO1_003584 [Acrasis kona]|uniref:F-box domain-containing protein n=1 Tax=Acrasis kona TaxID=1008807 RepID=A0AAW2Z6B3_9EUKA
MFPTDTLHDMIAYMDCPNTIMATILVSKNWSKVLEESWVWKSLEKTTFNSQIEGDRNVKNRYLRRLGLWNSQRAHNEIYEKISPHHCSTKTFYEALERVRIRQLKYQRFFVGRIINSYSTIKQLCYVAQDETEKNHEGTIRRVEIVWYTFEGEELSLRIETLSSCYPDRDDIIFFFDGNVTTLQSGEYELLNKHIDKFSVVMCPKKNVKRSRVFRLLFIGILEFDDVIPGVCGYLDKLDDKQH